MLTLIWILFILSSAIMTIASTYLIIMTWCESREARAVMIAIITIVAFVVTGCFLQNHYEDKNKKVLTLEKMEK